MLAIRTLLCLLLISFLTIPALAQVHYHDNGMPWSHNTRRGPDAKAGGWYYNLGITGIRAILMKEQPTNLLVKYVFEKSPADGKVLPGDILIGVNGKKFNVPHRNGYNIRVFGGHGPMRQLGLALDQSQSSKYDGKLKLNLLREEKPITVTLRVGTTTGSYGKNFPQGCSKSKKLVENLYQYLAENQRSNGSWGSPHTNTFAALALLASGDKKYLPVVKKNVKYHAERTKEKDSSWLINWRYMAAGIVMSEYYLKTKEPWVLPELQEIYDFLISTQYTDYSQVAESARKRKKPKNKTQGLGGWGHNPGYEGYGPIAMITAQGALTFSLMHECGIKVDRKLHEQAYEFLSKGTGRNGYLWYADSPSRHDRWADMGRTGASAIANYLSPYKDKKYREQALLHAKVIGDHPETLPDTHGSPLMGMGYTALGAHTNSTSFRMMMESNRWWFTLAECPDGTFYYQPNRDNYPSDFKSGASRLSASAAVAFVYSLHKKNLRVTQRNKK